MGPRIKRLLSVLLVFAMVFSLAVPAAAAEPVVASGETVQIAVGESATLRAYQWFATTTWTSSDEMVATVTDGVVTGVAEGTAVITATSESYFSFFGTQTTTYTVVVTGAEEDTGLTVEVGQTLQLEVDANGGTTTWTSSDDTIVTVDGDGLVTGVTEGDVTITAKTTKTSGGFFGFFWWGGSRATTTTEFDVTVVAGEAQPTEPTATEPEPTETEPVETEPTEPEPTEPEPTEPEPTEPDGIFTVSFDTNGGSDVPSQSIYANECAFRPADPTKEGYVFEEWYADDELTIVYDFTQPVTEDITLYAGWTELDVYIMLDPGTYDDNVVNRTVTGSVTYNIALDSITYELVCASSTTIGEIALAEADGFSIDVLLEDGDNVLTVTVESTDGTITSESVVLTFDSGHVYDSGEVFDANDERLIKIPIWYGEDTSVDPDEYLVANILSLYFHDHTTFQERKDFITETLGGEVAGYLNSLDMMQILLPNPLTNADAIGYTGETDLTAITEDEIWELADAIAGTYADLLDSVDPEYIYMNMELTITTNDPWDDGTNDDWWLEKINAYDAWEYDDYYNSDFLKNISLGVVDSGFRDDHQDLSGRISIISSEDTPSDHGTHVSGIIAATANNSVGIAGVMHNNGSVYAYDVGGSSGISDSSIKEGLTKAVEAGAKVINFSLGKSGNISSGSFTMKDSDIKKQGKTWSKNMGKLLAKGSDFIVVQSAGNGNQDGVGVNYWHNGLFCSIKESNCYSSIATPWSEAVTEQDIMDRILIVAAIGSDNALTSFSNGGTGELNIIAAPGDQILSTVTGGAYTDSNGITHANRNEYHRYYGRDHLVTNDPIYAYMSGTSMAAPVVTAVCGLTWSVNHYLTGAELVDIVMNSCSVTAGNGSAQTSGGMGIVDALACVGNAIDSRTAYSLTVVNALNGEGISATVKIHKDGPDGPLVGEDQIYYTNSDGFLTLPKLPGAMYWLEISAEGFLSTVVYANCWGSDEDDVNMGTVALTPELDEEEYRIILRWTGEPSDLDSHLVATTVDGDPYHVFYADKEPSPAYANLDYDDTSYEGPETVTILNLSGLKNVRYAVHDFTNRNETSSTVLSNSGAYVEVYKGSELIETFQVPVNVGGTEWDVFAIDAEGNIIPTNQMTYCEDPDYVLS